MSQLENRLFVSSSPHVSSGVSTPRIMWTVVASLAPAAAWSIYLFGMPALKVIVATTLFSVAAEAACCAVARKPMTVKDGSAALTGLILAMTLPPGLPIWISAVGAFFAVVVTKVFFGGLGQNLFNPAMTARVFLLIAFPGAMTFWLVPRGTGDSLFGNPVTAYDAAGKIVKLDSGQFDAITAATPLGILKEQGADAVTALSGGQDAFVGWVNGSLGETSALFLLLGGLFLLWRRIITWHIPVSFFATVAVFAAVTNAVDGVRYAGPVFHLFTGGVMIGAWFMATDYVTSPMHPVGKLIFGAGCGVLTMVIRLWAGYPEGVSFAVLLMNAAVPIIDSYTRPRKFGLKRIAVQDGGA